MSERTPDLSIPLLTEIIAPAPARLRNAVLQPEEGENPYSLPLLEDRIDRRREGVVHPTSPATGDGNQIEAQFRERVMREVLLQLDDIVANAVQTSLAAAIDKIASEAAATVRRDLPQVIEGIVADLVAREMKGPGHGRE